MFRAVKIALVRLLFDRRQFERAGPIKLLLDCRFSSRLEFVNFRQAGRAHLFKKTRQL